MNRCRCFRFGFAVSCLAVLFAALPVVRCVAADDPRVLLDEQKAKLDALAQELIQKQGEAEILQNELKQRLREAQAQRQQAEAAYQAAQHEYREAQVAAARAAAKDRQVVVYALQHLTADEAVAATSRVLNPEGTDELSLAIDERANRVIASGTQKRIEELAALLQKLDVETQAMQQNAAGPGAAEMLQVRIIWLANPMTSQLWQSAEGKLDERVLKALEPLGFPAPEIACQTVTSIVVDDKKPNSFAFTVPVTIGDRLSTFQGKGKLTPRGGDKYLLQVELGVGGGQDAGCQLQGSIITPLKNYTVLGTGVVVQGSEGKQMPCAFVLQLNRTESEGEAAGN
jgi:multidrug efflux pump subunit AcrA (membrane-fusion protein)